MTENGPTLEMPSTAVVAQLAEWLDPRPSTLRFRAYRPGVPNVGSGADHLDDKDAYWQASYGGLLEEIGLVSEKSVPDDDAKAAIRETMFRLTRHSSALDSILWQTCDKVTSEWLNEFANSSSQSMEPGDGNRPVVVALTSSCLTGHGQMHIPMLDFRCSKSARSLYAVQCGLQAIGQKRGLILRSGRSYHYIGFQLLSDAEILDFIGKALLLLPLADGRYLGHRLLEAELSLRVTGCDGKEVPTVEHILEQS